MTVSRFLNGTKWYQLSVEQAFEALEAGDRGLTSSEAKARLGKYGYNELKFKKRGTLIRFLLQFHSPLIYVLLAAALVTGFLGHLIDTAVILGVVIANTIIGFIQEGRAEASIEALEKMMVPECTVLRDGERKIIPARELVPGDVVLFEGGDRVPADLRLFYTKNLEADEAALTGESVPVKKNVDPISRPNLPPADQHCITFSGTFITRGSGQGIVVGTGEHTEIGRIAELMKETKRITTPMMRKMAQFTKFLVIAILAIAALNFILAIVFGYGFMYSFLAAVSLAVAAIPEGLPAILTITLAFGVTAMARRNALIRRLPAAEALGCTTVICSDKTGTLTKNQMTVSRIYCGGKEYRVRGVGYEPKGEFILKDKVINPAQENEELIETLRAGLLCNNAALVETEEIHNIVGDPTEGALIVSAIKAGVAEKPPRLDEIPFESEQQYMATLHQGDGENIIYVKGSPERVLGMCRSQVIDGSIEPLRGAQILGKADEMAGDALRVLGMAYQTVPKGKRSIEAEDLDRLTFLGLQGMIDPPREEAIEAVAKCKRAGIRTVMITGDHAQTAEAIARELGIGGNRDKVLTGEKLQGMSDEELYEVVDRVSVYARVAPEHKFRITTQLQRRGHIVAVTGDGVNDAPALKAADIGVAMGITGTEVSKEASDMVLADDNFASIVAAVEEGRHIFENIRKIILYTLPTNGGQALLILGAVLLASLIPLFALRLPLEPIHILWINLFDAVFLALALTAEPKETGLLERPPRDPKERIANRLFFRKVGLVSLVMAAAGFAIYYHYGATALSSPVDELLLTQAQTATLATVILVHICYLFTARSITESAFTFSPFSNKWVLMGIAVTIAAMLMLIYIPFIQVIFRTAAFPAVWWIPIILLALTGFFVIEIEKFLKKRLGKG
ncbi:putative cation-transporting ATPase F [subsurface metagenome]